METNKHFKQNKIRDILIVNVHSSQNAGDHALLLQTISYLEEAFGEASFSIMANWPTDIALNNLDHEIIGSPWWVIGAWNKAKKPRFQALTLISGIFWLLFYRLDFLRLMTRIIPKKWLRIYNSYINSDLVVAVSGNQLFSSGRYGWLLFVVGLPFLLARFFKKETIVFPQSIGPLKSENDKKFVQYLYNNVRKVFVRDLVSLELVKILDIRKSNPTFMHDVAFTFESASFSEAVNILKSYRYTKANKNLGITIISSMPSYLSSDIMQNYYNSVAESLDVFVNQQSFQVYLFSQVYGPTEDENDFNGIEQVMNRLTQPTVNKIQVIEKELPPDLLKACYGLMDIFIASRLHSGIFSLGMEVPTLFIGYLHKTAGILKSLDMEEYLIDLRNVTSLAISSKLLKMWEGRHNIKENIKIELGTVNRELAEFPYLIQSSLGKHDN